MARAPLTNLALSLWAEFAERDELISDLHHGLTFTAIHRRRN